MTAQNAWLFLHLAGVLTWVGGGIAVSTLTARLFARGDRAGLFAHLRNTEFVGKAVLMPASVATLVGGIGLMAAEHVEMQPWVGWGFGALVVAAVLGATFARRAAAAVLASGGAEGAGRLVAWNATILLVLVSAVAAMVFKPM